MNRAILLPVYPEYANRILTGEKRFEYRSRIPQKAISHIVIYATTPIKKIIGIAEVEEIISGAPSSLWEKTKYAAGIPRSGFRRYFSGRSQAHAFKIGAVWHIPEKVAYCFAFRIPQAFTYLDAGIFDSLLQTVRSFPAVLPELAFVGGVHGIGKDYFAQKYLKPMGGFCQSASTLIENTQECLSRNKYTVDIEGNQEILLQKIKDLQQKHFFLVITGHFILLNAQGKFEKIPEDIFIRMAPTILVLLTDSPSQIQKRLLLRDNIYWDLDKIKAFQKMEICYANELAGKLEIPLLIHNGKTRLTQFVRNRILKNNTRE